MPGDNTMNGKPQLQDFKTTSQKQHTNEKKNSIESIDRLESTFPTAFDKNSKSR